jgi:transcriptional regulator with XRE-family HTH domain
MKLKDFLKEEKITQEQFAKVIGVSQATVSRWCDGFQKPNQKMMTKILIATQGKVTANDFYYEVNYGKN